MFQIFSVIEKDIFEHVYSIKLLEKYKSSSIMLRCVMHCNIVTNCIIANTESSLVIHFDLHSVRKPIDEGMSVVIAGYSGYCTTMLVKAWAWAAVESNNVSDF